ncbi:MAG: tripartite tricarboxylate transporter substrate-binding protein, partial [Burkholderiaceae bacterium]
QGFIVENLPGAAGLIGADKVAKAKPDGYTLGGFNDSILTMVPNVNRKLPWNPIKDFAPISLAVMVEWGLVVPPKSPYANAGELIAAARQNPGQLNYGSAGNGSPQQIAMEIFASEAGIKMTHIPYKGINQTGIGVASGEVQAAFITLASSKTLVKSNRLKLIGVTSPKRALQYPNVPTIAESGLPGFEFSAWFALVAPAGTPQPIIQKLNAELIKALKDPTVRQQLLANGLNPVGSSPEELAKKIQDQLASYAALVKKTGMGTD